MRDSRMYAVAVAAILALGIAATASAQDVTVPAAWAGIWQIHMDAYTCNTTNLVFSNDLLDTLCTGAVFEQPAGDVGFTLDCSASLDGDTVTMHCTGSGEEEGCTISYDLTSTVTISGDSYTADGTTQMVYGGACAFMPPSCMHTVITGTRIAGPPLDCSPQAVRDLPWGKLKGIYR